MPIYDYKCDGCGHTFEETRRMADPPLTLCPECQEEKVRKVLSTGGVLGSIKNGEAGGGGPPMPPCAGGGCASGMCGL
ncbi:MAG: zinc ribbon domain-containing protein [Magnetococcales bacterium]|nr:zinc ribbon domain-containing protein [Magnetococcales bacterium]